MSSEQITPKRANILLANRISSVLRHLYFMQNDYKDNDFQPDEGENND